MTDDNKELPIFRTTADETVEQQRREIEELKAKLHGVKSLEVWAWLSAALEDSNVCNAMKRDIQTAFDYMTEVDPQPLADRDMRIDALKSQINHLRDAIVDYVNDGYDGAVLDDALALSDEQALEDRDMRIAEAVLNAASIECYKTRHVTLGDTIRNINLAEVIKNV